MPTYTVSTAVHDRAFCGTLGDELLSQPDGGFSIIHEHVDDDTVKLTIPGSACTSAEFSAFVAAYVPSGD